MALKKPLVLSAAGQVQQLQPGDTITAPSYVQYTNGEAAEPIVIGTPVYLSAADTVKRAQANASGTTDVMAMAAEASIAPAATGNFVGPGELVTATTQQWDAVKGGSGGLTPGAVYFLDAANPGKLVTTPPSATGQYLTRVGRAKSATDLLFGPQPPIGL